MPSPYEHRERERKRLVASFRELDPEASKDAIVEDFESLDPQLKRETLVAAMREDQWFRDQEAAAIVADFLSDPQAERLVLQGQLLDWVAENSTVLASIGEAMEHPGLTASAAASGLRVNTWFNAFDSIRRREVRKSLLNPQALIADGYRRIGHVESLLASARRADS